MYAYIDALFSVSTRQPAAEQAVGSFLTTDCPEIRNTQPVFVRPRCILVATSSGDVEFISNESTRDLLTNLNSFLTKIRSSENVSFVGWYLDQIVFPVLCSNAMAFNVALPGYLFRGLGEKWSKTNGISIERAFIQGWYPEDQSRVIRRVTLDSALGLSGMPQIDMRIECNSDIDDTNMRILMSRVAAISELHTRYSNLLNSGGSDHA